MDSIEGTARNFNDMSAIELFAFSAMTVLWLAFVGLWVWLIWKVIRAQLRIPDELTGIRKALERIADKIEKS
jgi:hypothetical protein